MRTETRKLTHGDKLMWGDQDRRTPLHDEICFWIKDIFAFRILEKMQQANPESPLSLRVSLEYPLKTIKRFYSGDPKETICGYLDAVAFISARNSRQYVIAFEAKTRIQSAGELLRQVKHYQEISRTKTADTHANIKIDEFVVVAPEISDRIRLALNDEGIQFKKYEVDIFS